MNENTKTKLVSSFEVLVKEFAPFGKILDLFDKLDEIWNGTPIEDKFHQVKQDILQNLTQVIEQLKSENNNQFDILKTHFEENFKKIESEILLIFDNDKNKKISQKKFPIQLLHNFISIGLSEEQIPNEFNFANTSLNDIDFEILTLLSDKPPKDSIVNLNYLIKSVKGDYHKRDILFSLNRLSSFGFFKLQSNDYESIKEIEWILLKKEIEEFKNKLKLFPFMAIIINSENCEGLLPMINEGRIKNYSQIGHMMLNGNCIIAAIRLHPTEGYQFKAKKLLIKDEYSSNYEENKTWSGSNFEFKFLEDAKQIADEILIENGEKYEWFYLSV